MEYILRSSVGFKLVKTGITYAEQKDDTMQVVPDIVNSSSECSDPNDPFEAKPDTKGLSSIIWKDAADEYRSLLVIREAELVLAKAQLTGNKKHDWYLNNRITELESTIDNLKKWLTESKENTQILEQPTTNKKVENPDNLSIPDVDLKKQQTLEDGNPKVKFYSGPDVAEALGMSVDSALGIWCSNGTPVIHLRQGEDCNDLRKLLSWSDVTPEQLLAVRAWLQEHQGGDQC